jgi:hypothetical protein
MIVAADHVRDRHVGVIDDDGEVVRRCAVGAANDQVVELGVVEDNPALD